MVEHHCKVKKRKKRETRLMLDVLDESRHLRLEVVGWK